MIFLYIWITYNNLLFQLYLPDHTCPPTTTTPHPTTPHPKPLKKENNNVTTFTFNLLGIRF